MEFYDSDDNLAGRIRVNFSDPLNFKYRIPDCMSDPAEMDSAPTPDKNKVWRLTIDRRDDYVVHLIIHCNKELVLNHTISSSNCDGSYLNEIWIRKISSIGFTLHDNASDNYRPYKPGNSINTHDFILYRLK